MEGQQKYQKYTYATFILYSDYYRLMQQLIRSTKLRLVHIFLMKLCFSLPTRQVSFLPRRLCTLRQKNVLMQTHMIVFLTSVQAPTSDDCFLTSVFNAMLQRRLTDVRDEKARIENFKRWPDKNVLSTLLDVLSGSYSFISLD